MELLDYDKYLVTFSGGKDSMACLLYLLEAGVDKSKIELHHHEIDGREETFMDWEVTPAYCQAVADAFGIPLYFSWKEGGFKRELLRNNALTAPTIFEDENHQLHRVGGKRGNLSTRRKFPQVSADLSIRWCSAYLKIDVFARSVSNQKRFNSLRIAVLSGERGEESTARANYATLEPDRSDSRLGRKQRYVDRLRPIRDWKEQQVWEIIERWHVRAHPAYFLGWSRVSCKFCIFGNSDQFASGCQISPAQGNVLMNYEEEFGVTIKRKLSLRELVTKGKPYPATINDPDLVRIATSTEYTLPIFVDNWQLPAGAYGEGCGPS